MKHKSTNACEISPKTKRIVEERDGGRCIFCGSAGLPEAHYISRAQLGLGIPENVITACRSCHDDMDKTLRRDEMKHFAKKYLEHFYPDFKDEDRIYNKWGWLK